MVSDKAVSKWERGVNYPDISLFDEIAKTLDLSLVELLGIEDRSKEEIVQNISEISKYEKEKIGKICQVIRGWLSFYSLASYPFFSEMQSDFMEFISQFSGRQRQLEKEIQQIFSDWRVSVYEKNNVYRR